MASRASPSPIGQRRSSGHLRQPVGHVVPVRHGVDHLLAGDEDQETQDKGDAGHEGQPQGPGVLLGRRSVTPDAVDALRATLELTHGGGQGEEGDGQAEPEGEHSNLRLGQALVHGSRPPPASGPAPRQRPARPSSSPHGLAPSGAARSRLGPGRGQARLSCTTHCAPGIHGESASALGPASDWSGTAGMAGQFGGRSDAMDIILWILAVILVVSGIVALTRRQLLWGIVLIVVGLLVGPGGVSILS